MCRTGFIQLLPQTWSPHLPQGSKVGSIRISPHLEIVRHLMIKSTVGTSSAGKHSSKPMIAPRTQIKLRPRPLCTHRLFQWFVTIFADSRVNTSIVHVCWWSQQVADCAVLPLRCHGRNKGTHDRTTYRFKNQERRGYDKSAWRKQWLLVSSVQHWEVPSPRCDIKRQGIEAMLVLEVMKSREIERRMNHTRQGPSKSEA